MPPKPTQEQTLKQFYKDVAKAAKNKTVTHTVTRQGGRLTLSMTGAAGKTKVVTATAPLTQPSMAVVQDMTRSVNNLANSLLRTKLDVAHGFMDEAAGADKIEQKTDLYRQSADLLAEASNAYANAGWNPVRVQRIKNLESQIVTVGRMCASLPTAAERAKANIEELEPLRRELRQEKWAISEVRPGQDGEDVLIQRRATIEGTDLYFE